MGGKKLSPEEFTIRAITRLRTGRYRGIHSVYSGYNAAFRQYFNADPVEATKAMVAQGVIESHPTRGGAMLYLPGEKPQKKDSSGDKALNTILAIG